MNVKNILLIGVLILFAGGFSFANSDGTVSIGIVTDSSQALKKSALVLLLEVELSQRVDIKLLERAEIDKILEEHRLNAAGLQDRTEIIKIGQLLRADALIMLSLESQIEDANDLIRVRFAETAHGLRLMDYFEQSDSKNPQESVKNIVQELESVLKKINQPDEKLIPVGIVDIHRVQLGEQYKILERTLPTMLSVRLSLEPRIIMLEREDLQILLDEKLTTEGEYTEFWSSAILIDGYIQPNIGQLEMHLNLKQAGGSILQSLIVPVEPNEPTIAINTAVTEIIQNLQDSPPNGKWNPKLEAEQFYKQGQMLSAHGRYEEAIPLFETSHALQPKNVNFTTALFGLLWKIRCEDGRRGNNVYSFNIWSSEIQESYTIQYSDLELAELVSILVRQIKQVYEKDDSIPARYVHVEWGEILGNRLNSRYYFSNPISVSSEKIRKINKTNREIWVDVIDNALIRRGIKTGYPFLYQRPNLLWISNDEPEELFVQLKEMCNEFIMPTNMGGAFESPIYRRRNCNRLLLDYGPYNSNPDVIRGTHLKNSLQYIITQWTNYLKELTECKDPLVRYYAFLALTVQQNFINDIESGNLASNSKPIDTELAISYCNKALEVLTKELLGTWYFQDDGSLMGLCKAMKNTFNSIENIDASRLVEIWERVFEPLIVNKNIHLLSLWDPGYESMRINLLASKPKSLERYYKLLDRVSNILSYDSADDIVTRALARIDNTQNEILSILPELREQKSQPRLTVKILLKYEEWKKLRGNNVLLYQLKEDILYLAGIGSSMDPIGTLKYAYINLNSGKLTILPKIKYDFPSGNKFINPGSLSGLAVLNNTGYISFNNYGIIVLSNFPSQRNELNPKNTFLNKDNILPSNYITGIASDGDKLWVAYGNNESESGLGVYDPNTELWETVFCSTLKNEFPLSYGQPYLLRSLTFISPDKLFFSMSPRGSLSINLKGLWMLDTKTRSLKYFGYTGMDDSRPLGYLESAEGQLWVKGNSSLVKLDPESGEALHFMGRWSEELRKKRNKESDIKMLICRDELFMNYNEDININIFGSGSEGCIDLMTCAVHEDTLWVCMGQTKIAIIERGESLEDAEIIDNNLLDGEAVHRFVSTPYGLVGIGEGTVGLIETKE